MYKGKRIGVVVPAYNEALLIANTINSIPGFADRIYVVNDASNDDTYEIVSSISRQNGKLAIVTHEKNRGVGAAIVTGYKMCLEEDMDIAVVMAGDNQMNPAELINLLIPIVKGKADYTKGNRMLTRSHLQGMTPWRRFGNWQLRWLTRIASGNYTIMDPQNGYTAISQSALIWLKLDSIYPGYGYCNDILVKLCVSGARIVEVSMPARYGREESKIRYHSYIPKVSWLLFRRFIWRLSRIIMKQN